MTRNVLPQIAIMSGGIALGFGAFTLIPVFGYAAYSAVKKLKQINNGIKDRVADRYVEMLSEHARDRSKAVGKKVYQNLIIVRDAWDKGFDSEIETVRQQLAAVREERKKGEEAVGTKTRELEALRKQLEAIDGRLDDTVAELTGVQALVTG